MNEIIAENNNTTYLTDYIDKTQIKSINSSHRKDSIISYFEKLPEHEKLMSSNKKKNLKDCCSYLLFRDYYNISKVKLQRANFCGVDKLCPFCASRRAYKQQMKIEKFFEINPEYLSKNWFYIVLPVKHEINESFEIVFNRLRNGLNKIRYSINNNKNGKGKKSFFSQFDGLFYSIETTYNHNNGWNVHVNIMACSSVEFDYDLVEKINHQTGKYSYHSPELSLEWEKYTGSFIHNISKLNFETPEQIKKNLLEIFKYSVKFSELFDIHLHEFYEFTQSKRLLGAIGCFYGLKLDVLLEGDIQLDDDFVEYLYQRFDDDYLVYTYKAILSK
jgi:hypothetical protein